MRLQLTPRHEAQVREFLSRHRVGLLTILFTDIVGSVELKRHLGDLNAVLNIQRHHALVREILRAFPEGEEVETAGDSFLLVFAKPSDAVKFALTLTARLRALGGESAVAIRDRIGIHLGEVLIADDHAAAQKSLFGTQVDTAARVMSLAGAGQILVTRAVFDNARQVLKGRDLAGVGELLWMNHGPYLLKGVDGALDICEAGEVGLAPLQPPADSDKAARQVSADGEPVLGWRPAVGQVIPKTQWELTEKLGEGGFGEVWLARHQTLKDTRVFKFCFRADRVRSLKREVTLFRLLRERVGEHPHIVRLMDIYFEEPPYYLEMEHVPGRDLATWVKEQGGLENVPMNVRLEIVAQVADALQAAHDCGIIHRDIKPSNILISSLTPSEGERAGVRGATSQISTPSSQLSVKLTDFGIGQIVSEEALGEITNAGFTQTLLGSTAGSYSGTRLYMAPELLTAQKATPRSDIYSLGVVLYQLAVGDLGRPLTIDWARQVADPLLREDLEQCFAGDPQERLDAASVLAKRLRSMPARRAALEAEEQAQHTRERAAYRRGVMRTAALATCLIAVFVGLAIYAWLQNTAARGEAKRANMAAKSEAEARRRAELARAEANAALQMSRIRTANAHVEAGEHSAALSLLALVVRQDPGNELAGNRLAWLMQDRGFFGIHSETTNGALPSSAVLSPDGQRYAVISNGNVGVWDIRTRQPVIEPIRIEPIRSAAMTVDFSPDGSRLVTASKADQGARIWDATTSLPLTELIPPPTPYGGRFTPTSTRFSPDGRRVAAGAFEGMVALWDAQSGQPTLLTNLHKWLIHSVRFSPDGGRILTASADQTARVSDAATGKELSKPLLHNSPVTEAVFSPNGMSILTLTEDFMIRIWDAQTAQLLAGPLRIKASKGRVQFTKDGRRIEVAENNGRVTTWAVFGGPPLSKLLWQLGGISSARFSPDGQRLVTASADKTITLFGPDGQAGGYTVKTDNTPTVWNTKTGVIESVASEHTRDVTEHTRDVIVNYAEFSPDGNSIVTSSYDGTARVWDARTGKPITEPLRHGGSRELEIRRGGIRLGGQAHFSPDGARVATTSMNSARVWDARTGKPLCEPMQHRADVQSAQFSRDGSRLVTVSWETVTVWDVASGQAVSKPLQHNDPVLDAQFSPDGKQVATGAGDAVVRIWNWAEGSVVARLLGHENQAWRVQFSPDGRWIASTSKDNTARVWNARSFEPVPNALTHRERVSGVHFSPDGRRIVTASSDATARVWDARTGLPLSEPLPHRPWVSTAEFSPDGLSIWTSSQWGVRIWDGPVVTGAVPSWLPRLAEIIAGRRLTDQGVFEVVSSSELHLMEGILKNLPDDALTRWGKWLIADRDQRTVSPFSTVTVAQYVRRRVEEKDSHYLLDSLREAACLSPTNGLAYARLAKAVLEGPTRQFPRLLGEADFFSRHALQWSPDDPEVKKLREEVTETVRKRSPTPP